MTRAFRIFLPYALSVLLALMAQGVAASRGMDRAVGQMVLCTGTGPVVVYMDENGQPTKASHYCPDYALNLLGAVFADQPPHSSAPDRVQPDPPRETSNLVVARVHGQPARGPPVRV
ncbi:hypothetical protein [Ruegeria intermedia]|nr:hypothetical protein [Ruegeria intermedia]